MILNFVAQHSFETARVLLSRRGMKGNRMKLGIGQWVTRRAFLNGGRTALISNGAHITYADLDRRTNQVAAALIALGVRKGDRVAMLLVNSTEFIEVLLAAPKWAHLQFRSTCALPDPRSATSWPTQAPMFWSSTSRSPRRPGAPSPSPESACAMSCAPVGCRRRASFGYEDVVSGAALEPLNGDVDGSDPAFIMYTSGTTGRPKGAILTHDNLLWNAINVLGTDIGLRGEDVTVVVAPMFHIGGLSTHPAAALRRRHQRHHAVLRAASYAAGDGRPPRHGSVHGAGHVDRSHTGVRLRPSTCLRCVSPWAAGRPSSHGHRLHARARRALHRGLRHDRDRPLVTVPDAENISKRAGSIGRVAMHVDARIVDDDDRDVATDTVGELIVRGPNVFTGYWMKAEASAEALREGWFHTGDLGRMDAEGFITLVDRKKDMIISGGENVYPIEVEQVLFRHPAVTPP